MLERIKKIASLIKPCDLVVDVGSDHANLAIFLLKNKKVKKVINIDINSSPLAQGVKNLEKNNLIDQTENWCNDGLKNITLKHIHYLTCSGLGGNTIIDIIKNNNNPTDYLLLVPNNNAYQVRKYLDSIEGEIIYEAVLQENNHYYELILFDKKRQKSYQYNETDFLLGPYLLQHIDDTIKKYYLLKLKLLKQNEYTIKKYQHHIKIIKEIISNYENQ